MSVEFGCERILILVLEMAEMGWVIYSSVILTISRNYCVLKECIANIQARYSYDDVSFKEDWVGVNVNQSYTYIETIVHITLIPVYARFLIVSIYIEI